MLGGGALDLDVQGAGLDDGDPGVDVDLDRSHPLGGQHDAAVDGERTARQPGAGSARDDGDSVPARPAHRRHHVVGVFSAHDRRGMAGAGVVRPVEAVLLDGILLGDDHPGRQGGDQLGDGALHGIHGISGIHPPILRRECGSGGQDSHFRTRGRRVLGFSLTRR